MDIPEILKSKEFLFGALKEKALETHPKCAEQVGLFQRNLGAQPVFLGQVSQTLVHHLLCRE